MLKGLVRKMDHVIGDIWKYLAKNDAIVIPCNVGWKTGGRGVMGKGLARDAARRWPSLPIAWGEHCRTYRENTSIGIWTVPTWCRLVICFPTKPLNQEKPFLSWFAASTVEFITFHLKSLKNLADELETIDHILVPSLGAGCGGLEEAEVRFILSNYLSHPKFTHVTREEETR